MLERRNKMKKTKVKKEKKRSLLSIFKVIFSYVKQYKKDTYLTWMFVLLESVCEISVAFLMQNIVRGIKASDLNMVGIYSGIVGALVILAAITGILGGYFSSSAACGFAANLRKAEYEAIQKFSFSNIDKFSTSSIVTRTTTDVSNVQFAFQMTIRTVIRSPFMLILSLVMAFVTAPSLAWIFLILIPIALGGMVLCAKVVHPIFINVFNTYDALNESVEENVDGIRVVKSYNREEYQTKKFNKVSDFLYRNFVKAERITALNSPILNLAIDIAMILISALGAILIVKTSGTTFDEGSLTTLITYVMMIFNSLMLLSMVYVMIIIARNSTERIVELLEEVPDIRNPENPIMNVDNGEIVFDNVSFAYVQDKDVLKHINLKVKSGSSIGIIGSTGSGKTSLISLIARLYDVREGSVKVAGHDVRDYDLTTLRDAVSVVLQKNTLFSGTIRSNLCWGNPNATDAEIWEALELAQCASSVRGKPGELDAPVEQGGANFSGGQKQRLCIARALLKNPKILILDDSTSACDTATDSAIRHGLANNRTDLTKIIIAQRVLSIKDCDQILVLDNGEIVGLGTSEELLKDNEVYRTLFESQLGGGGDFDAEN